MIFFTCGQSGTFGRIPTPRSTTKYAIARYVFTSHTEVPGQAGPHRSHATGGHGMASNGKTFLFLHMTCPTVIHLGNIVNKGGSVS